MQQNTTPRPDRGATSLLSVGAWPQTPTFWAILAGLASMACFLVTLQWQVNGSQSPYATDVGEIQNALPRWGTIHFTGYPQYSALGSLFVTVLRAVGIGPAAGTSLFSALWGACTSALFVLVAAELAVPLPLGMLASLAAALSTSMWMDASIAEVHTATMALTMASFWLGLRYARDASPRTLAWLTVAFTQGVAHQRAVAFMLPALVVIVWPRLREIISRWRRVIALALLAPLTYLYLPIRAWMGADWTFGAPGTWHGFWTMILDTKSERILEAPDSAGGLLDRARITATLIGDDWPLWLVAAGMVGIVLLLTHKRWRDALGLWLLAAPYALLCLIIWEGQVSDALLAVKLPVIYVAALGLAVAAGVAAAKSQWLGIVCGVLLLGVSCALSIGNRGSILAVTRDPGAEETIARVERLCPSSEPTTFWALWGHDYWALTYAQAYRDQLVGLKLVDHNADLDAVEASGDRILTLDRTFYERPLSWWQERLGDVALSGAAPGIVEIHTERQTSLDTIPPGAALSLGNGIEIAAAAATRSESRIDLIVYWHAGESVPDDYSVAVHLLAHSPPAGPEDILAQADASAPVAGWYPTSRWEVGEVVRDVYSMSVSGQAAPVAIRIAMYRQVGSSFENTDWLVLPLL